MFMLFFLPCLLSSLSTFSLKYERSGPVLRVSTFYEPSTTATDQFIGYVFVEGVPCAIDIDKYSLDSNDLSISWKLSANLNQFLLMVGKAPAIDGVSGVSLASRINHTRSNYNSDGDIDLDIWSCTSRIPLKLLKEKVVVSVTPSRTVGCFVFTIHFKKPISKALQLHQYNSCNNDVFLLEFGIV